MSKMIYILVYMYPINMYKLIFLYQLNVNLKKYIDLIQPKFTSYFKCVPLPSSRFVSHCYRGSHLSCFHPECDVPLTLMQRKKSCDSAIGCFGPDNLLFSNLFQGGRKTISFACQRVESESCEYLVFKGNCGSFTSHT